MKECTLVAPVLDIVPVWWPILQMYSVSSIMLGKKGENGILQTPGKNGYVFDEKDLRWDLSVYSLCFI